MKLSSTCILLFSSIMLLFSCSSEDTTTIPGSDTIEMDDDPQGEINEFKVMSYNISWNTFATHKDSLITIIKRNTIDILGAQELTGSIKTEFSSIVWSNFSFI